MEVHEMISNRIKKEISDLFTEVFDAQTAYVPVKAEMDQDFVNNWCNLDGFSWNRV
jgi:hypothetical protein